MLRESRDVLRDRGRLVLLEEVLGGDGMDLPEAGGAPDGLGVDAERQGGVVGAPDDLHGVGGIAQRARVERALSGGALEAA